ncbi:double-strand break repair protein MRE11 [Anopheles nili]|uniref:double-strand break repair protein MRE11 n=1 Tax=Anopheles nili TaxID=185578 RepID=UPI00237A1671|nr:double-strand break repair protein MRE11 [Anopheles nili]
MSESTSQQTDENPDDVLKILVASDIHLGYNEKDQIRGEDSFNAFEEVLQNAVVNDVDIILLGGDLFHMANPSLNTLNKCFRLLRTYTLGEKPIKVEFLSDQNENFLESLSRTVNYEDPNMNIAIPLFSIHGNHDDSTGFGCISSMDLLSTNGYVNYFGKWNDVSQIKIRPIMLQKGQTKLALYGLSFINDARLCRLFADGKVFMEKPDEPGFFNIMVLHQNRAERGLKQYLPENALPEFLDLVIWGHEHDCRIVPEENPVRRFYVSQPGSTVATSLSEGEALPKCCGLLSIYKNVFRMDPIPLKTVRPFEFETIDLAKLSSELELEEGDIQQKVIDYAAERVEELINRSQKKLTGYERQPKLPLIRLRLIVSNVQQQFNKVRFGGRFQGRVANSQDMVIFKVKKAIRPKEENDAAVDKDRLHKAYREGAQRVEEIVNDYFCNADEENQLEVVTPRGMLEVCRRGVDHDDDDAMEKILNFYKDIMVEYLRSKQPATEENIEELCAEFMSKTVDIDDKMLAMLDKRSQKTPLLPLQHFNIVDDDDAVSRNDDLPSARPVATRGSSKTEKPVKAAPAKPRGGGTRGGRGSRGGRGASKAATAGASLSQASISSMFSQSSANSSISSVATRTPVRKAPQRARQMSFDSDAD